MKIETFGTFLQFVKLMSNFILFGTRKCIVLKEGTILKLLDSLLTLLRSGTGTQFTSTLSLLRGLVWELKSVEQVCSAPKLMC